jgi:hypothetical protein
MANPQSGRAEPWAFVSEIREWHEFAEQALLAAEAEPNNLALCEWFAEKARIFPDGPQLVRQIWAKAQKARAARSQLNVIRPAQFGGPKAAAKPKAFEDRLEELDLLKRKPEAKPEPEAEAEPTGGALTVIEAKPQAVAETPEEQAVREMNDKHAVISNLGGSV